MRKHIPSLTCTVLLSVTVAACSRTGANGAGEVKPQVIRTARHAFDGTHTVHTERYLSEDGDKDDDDGLTSADGEYGSEDDTSLLAAYGPPANDGEAQAITSLLKRYYAAAAIGDGSGTCALLAHELVIGLNIGQSKPESRESDGCARAMTLLLGRQHRQLAAEDVETMTVVEVHVNGSEGLAVLGFRATPEEEMVVRREGHAWRVDALLGSYLT